MTVSLKSGFYGFPEQPKIWTFELFGAFYRKNSFLQPLSTALELTLVLAAMRRFHGESRGVVTNKVSIDTTTSKYGADVSAFLLTCTVLRGSLLFVSLCWLSGMSRL